MIKILYDPSFKRAYKKRIVAGSEREARFRSKIGLFMNDPFDSALKTTNCRAN